MVNNLLGSDENEFMSAFLKEQADLIMNCSEIYKFSTAESALKILQNNTLAFRNPLYLNDPYDCTLDLITFDQPPADYRQKLIDKHHRGLSANEKAHLLKQYKVVPDEFLAQFVKKGMIENDLSRRGLTSFSAKYDQMLMWAHYGHQHTGITIGFDIVKLYENIRAISHPERLLMKVKYIENFETLEYYRHPTQSIINWLRTKAAVWSYEEEIRLVLYDLNFDANGLYLMEVDPACISAVYMGSRISDEHRNALSRLMNNKFFDIPLFQMNSASHSFNLVRTLQYRS